MIRILTLFTATYHAIAAQYGTAVAIMLTALSFIVAALVLVGIFEIPIRIYRKLFPQPRLTQADLESCGWVRVRDKDGNYYTGAAETYAYRTGRKISKYFHTLHDPADKDFVPEATIEEDTYELTFSKDGNIHIWRVCSCQDDDPQPAVRTRAQLRAYMELNKDGFNL